MDSEGTLRDIGVIEFPVESGKLVQELFYEDYLFNNPEIISKDLVAFSRQFRLRIDETRYGTIDLLFINNETLIIGEVKQCRIDQLEEIKKRAILQTIRYVMAFDYLKPLLKEGLILKGLILIFVEGLKLRREYNIPDLNKIEGFNIDNYPPIPIYPQVNIINTQRGILKSLKGNVRQLRNQTTTLKGRIKKGNKKLKDIDTKIKKLLIEIQRILKRPFNQIINFIDEQDGIIKVIATGENILKINSILTEAGIRFIIESEEGIYLEGKQNENREAIFYLPSKIETEVFVSIQGLGEMNYYQTTIQEHSSEEEENQL